MHPLPGVAGRPALHEPRREAVLCRVLRRAIRQEMHLLCQANYRNRWYPFHLIRGPPLAQRLLHLRHLQDVAGRPRFHHRRAGRHLSGVRQAETDVNVTKENNRARKYLTNKKIKSKHRLT